MWRRSLCLISMVVGLFSIVDGARAETRLALVIGNSDYRTVSVLPNPANDARAMEKLLRDAGFEITSAPNLTQADMRRAIRDFATHVTARGGPNTVALVYYAGHGVQIDGENYLVPVDAKIERESDVAIEAVRLVDVMTALGNTASGTRIVVLDACRNNPFASIKQTTGRGLAIVDAPTGSIVSYSTAPGMEALDGAGDNSPFTAALVNVAREPNLPIEQAFKRVRLDVHKSTQGVQTPWESSSLTSDFSFFRTAVAKTEPGAKAAPSASANTSAAQASKPPSYWRTQFQGRRAEDAFEIVIREDVVAAYEEFLVVYATSPFAQRVRTTLERRREMIAWFTAVTVDTMLAYQAFLDRYPTSDLAETARRLRDRAQLRAQSANFSPGALGNPQQPGPGAPLVTPASLPVTPQCTCQQPQRKAEPAKPTRQTSSRPPKFVRELPPDAEYIPDRRSGPPVSIGIGIGIPIGRRPNYPSGGQHPHH
jgi:uncharacterized caspase-like protein